MVDNEEIINPENQLINQKKNKNTKYSINNDK